MLFRCFTEDAVLHDTVRATSHIEAAGIVAPDFGHGAIVVIADEKNVVKPFIISYGSNWRWNTTIDIIDVESVTDLPPIELEIEEADN